MAADAGAAPAAASAEEELLDPAFLERLRALFVKIRRRRRQKRQGVQQVPAAGHTREFKDHRHYARGDDYRAIDWRIYARLDRLFVRVFEEVQEYHVHLLLDRSQSMCDPHPAKRREALRLAVALGYLALANGHRLSLHSLAGDCRRELPPIKGQGHVHGLIEHLVQLGFGGAGDLAASLGRFRSGGDRRGIVFLISDLYGRDPDRTLEELRVVRSWPAETHVVQVADPVEGDPPYDGELRLECVETGERRRIWLTRPDLERYRERYAAWRESVARACATWQVDHALWTTDRPFEDQFVALLARGSGLGS